MTKQYTIVSIDVSDDDWTGDSREEWASDTDSDKLLFAFVSAVSDNEIDEVNRYWKVEVTQ